ncbi:MAG: response regulator [Gammaproteobacteria bacterium]|nr:response regulator [Gammaproteobacteria bacterium]
MRNWDIKKRVLFVALLPTLVITFVISIYFNVNRISLLEASMYEKGKIIANHLAPASEYAVFSGNMDILSNIIEKSLTDSDIINVSITDKNDDIIISRSRDNKSRTYQHSILSALISEEQITFSQAITLTEVEIDDFSTFEIAPVENIHAAPIGYVHITLSSVNTRVQQLDSLMKGLMIMASGLVFTVLLATRISRSVVEPIQKLTFATSQIAQGKLSTRISIDTGGEIGLLEEGINRMVDEVQLAREDLQIQVDKATLKLKKALDDLEIQNIELDLARNRALSASRIKSEFLANMSHEIRTPMNGVLGFAELLDKTSLDEQQRDYVYTIRNSASNLLTIINDILDFSKIEAGKLKIEQVSFNLPEVIGEIIAMFTPMAYKKGLELTCHPYPDIPHQMTGDPYRIRQILVNLIGNAIKFTHSGHVIFRVVTHGQNSDTLNLRFTVTDTGIGMDSTNKQRLFTAFSQADTSISRKFGGTGLGLVISKKLSELMHGDIGFESVLNQGTTFWLGLPLKADNTPKHKSATLSGRVILIDNPDQNRLALRMLLNQMGLDTIEAVSADKIPSLITESADNPVLGIVAGINRTNINNDVYILNLANRIKQAQLPYLVVASAFDQNEISHIVDLGITQVIYRCMRHDNFKEKIRQIFSGEVITMQNTPITIHHENAGNKDWKHLRVLLVDDNVINLKLAKTFLENRGVQVDTAEQGEQAISLTDKINYDLILMDLHMPKMDGFVATEHIRNHTGPSHNTIIIALTANAMPEEKLHVFNIGMNDILLKPISENSLFETITRWISKPRHEPGDPSINQIASQTTPVYDAKQGLELAGGNAQLATELFTMLINELPGHKQRIESSMHEADLAELKHHTHKLHGATSYCGVPLLRQCARELEQYIDNKQHMKIDKATHDLLIAIDLLIEYSSSQT